ncbi:MAG: CoA transferase, partial [Staphylococcus hominis]
TAMLAQWGADVIKIERAEGDPMRRSADHPGVTSPVFEMDNRGKRSVVLDLSAAAGRQAARALVGSADVFVTSTRPAALRRAGLDWASLSGSLPRLIHASVTGYGPTGPDADLPGFDMAAFWARSGAAALSTPEGVTYFPIRIGMGDHSCSLSLALGIMAALYARERTGCGREVRTSLLRSGAYAVSSDLTLHLRGRRVRPTRRRELSAYPLINFFRSADGHWVLLMPRDSRVDWPRMAAAADRPDLVHDPRFATAAARSANVTALIEALDAGFDALPFAELRRRLRDADLVWAPVQTPAQFVEDEQAHAAGCFDEGVGEGGDPFGTIAPPVDAGNRLMRLRVPGIGEHTDAVLAELSPPARGGAER